MILFDTNGLRSLFLLGLSIIVQVAFFALGVHFYSFSEIDKTVLDSLLPVTAGQASRLAHYRFWYPVALVYLPLATYWTWRGLDRIFGNFKSSALPRERELVPDMRSVTLVEAVLVCLLCLFLFVSFSYGSFFSYAINFHHLNYMTGPINDLLNGKSLLVDTSTQYGFLNVLFLAFIFKYFVYFSHPNFYFVSMIHVFIEYFSIYFLLRRLRMSRVVSLIGLIAAAGAGFYSHFPVLMPSEVPHFPGFVWRYSIAAPVFLWITFWHGRESAFVRAITACIVAVATLWQQEVGVCILAGYLAYVFFSAFLEQLPFGREDTVGVSKTWTWKEYLLPWLNAAVQVRSLLIGIGGIVLTYTGIIYLKFGAAPNWQLYFKYTRLAGVIGWLHGDALGSNVWAYWPLLIYSIVFVFIGLARWAVLRVSRWSPGAGNSVSPLPVVGMIATYGFCIFRFYLGNSWLGFMPFVTTVPGVLLAIWILANLPFERVRVHLRERNWQARRLFPLAGGLAIFCFGIVGGYAQHAVRWAAKLHEFRIGAGSEWLRSANASYPPNNRLITHEAPPPTMSWDEIENTIAQIDRYLPKGEPIAIIGKFDHIFMMQAQRVSRAESWYAYGDVLTLPDRDRLGSRFQDAPFLFVDKMTLSMASGSLNAAPLAHPEAVLLEVFRSIRPNFVFEKDIGLLYVYRHR